MLDFQPRYGGDLAPLVLPLNVSSFVDEHLCHVKMASLAGTMQRRVEHLASAIYRNTTGQDQFHDLLMPLTGCPMQWRQAPTVIYLCANVRAFVKQKLHGFFEAVLARKVQGCQAIAALHIDFTTLADEEFRNLFVLGAEGPVEGC